MTEARIKEIAEKHSRLYFGKDPTALMLNQRIAAAITEALSESDDSKLLDWLEINMKDGHGLMPHIKLNDVQLIYCGQGGVGVSLRSAIRAAMQ